MNTLKQSKFEIKQIIEQQPFKDPVVRRFFQYWCKINDFIKLKFVTREEWVQELDRGKGILVKEDDKQLLYLPKDLHLWEIVGIVEAIDRETFAQTKPERITAIKEKFQKLARLFQNAGIYVAQRLDQILEGKEIAQALAQEFYDYGKFLEQGKRLKNATLEEIKAQKLTQQEIEEVDQFLAGETLYESRKKRLEVKIKETHSKKEELTEAERIKTLAQFFQVAQKAFLLQAKTKQGQLKLPKIELKPWQSDTPIHNAFLQRIKEAITRQSKIPETELTASIFRRGMKLLLEIMPFDKLPQEIKDAYLSWQNGESTLRKALKIDELKDELSKVRQTGNVQAIAKKEKEVADKIQRVISRYPYYKTLGVPRVIIDTQHRNCLGASILGGTFFQELGLNYLVASWPEHCFLILVRSDGKIEQRDMLLSKPVILNDEIIEPISVKDIVSFHKNQKRITLRFKIKRNNKVFHTTVMHPEYGHLVLLLNNVGSSFYSLGYYQEAIQAYQKAIEINPKHASAYYNLGCVFYELKKYQEAIQAYQKAIKINPEYASAYYNLGCAFYELKKYQEAIQAYQKAIKINPEYASAYYNLGITLYELKKYQEAIQAYQKAIKINPEYASAYYNLGCAFYVLKNYSEAMVAYQQFLQLADEKRYALSIRKTRQIISEIQKHLSEK